MIDEKLSQAPERFTLETNKLISCFSSLEKDVINKLDAFERNMNHKFDTVDSRLVMLEYNLLFI